MNVVRIVFVALVVFVIQVTAIHRIAIAGCTPDLTVILLVALVLERGPVFAVVIGFLLSFLQDLGNASLLGMNALAKSVLAYGVARVGGGFLLHRVRRVHSQRHHRASDRDVLLSRADDRFVFPVFSSVGALFGARRRVHLRARRAPDAKGGAARWRILTVTRNPYSIPGGARFR